MVVPFGISIGDFIAVGQLAFEIAAALSDCRGAAAEYKSLIELLKSLKTSISLISNFVSDPSRFTALNVDQAFMNGLAFHAGCCHRLLTQFVVDSRKYTDKLVNGQGNRVQKTFRKLKWSLYSAEDARKLEQRLSSHLEAFDRYLLAVDIQLGAQSTDRLERQVGQISYTLAEIVKSVQTTQLNLPKALGYPWEGDEPSSYVRFDDAIGRSTVLPAVLCRTFDTFQDTLKIMFSDHPGFGKVTKGEFEIIDETTGRTIFPGPARTSDGRHQSLIDAGIKPGTKISMNIVSVKTLKAPKDFLVPSVRITEDCPNCGHHTLGRKFRKCLNCNLSFRKTVLESFRERPTNRIPIYWRQKSFPPDLKNTSPDGPDEASAQYATDRAAASVGLASRSDDAEIERRFFRRVHHVTKYLVPYQDRTNFFDTSRLPLIQAAGQGDVQWVRDLLLHTDTDPDCRSHQGWTALQQACWTTLGNPTAVVKLLIASGADVNAKPWNGFSMTALEAACNAGNAEIVDILLQEGAELNADSGRGTSALIAASTEGHFGIVKKLLDFGADINQLTHYCTGELGRTALSAAAAHGDIEMIDYLVQRGAELQAEQGCLALATAVFFNKVDLVSHLLELGANVNTEMGGQAPVHFVHSLEMLNLLVAHGVQVNRPSSRPGGRTALQRVARDGKLDLVKELIRLGSDIHATGPDIRGRTALQSAASGYSDALPVIKLLIDEYGADVNEARCSEEGYTSLEAACHSVADEESSDLGIVEFLLERGAKVTPFTLHVAAAFGHTTLVRLLLRNGARIEEPSHIGIVLDGWEYKRRLGSNVIETAQLNGHWEHGMMLKAWIDSTLKDMHPMNWSKLL
ncbi:MAG: hypothetical protein M1822_006573 [Bathelium mastoideum]|nr:MAG: hypothetical protein M1822_006573 [Bathelium mastoideum]